MLTAAEAAIAEHGTGASMEQIASAAGVSKATLYDNFDGKAGLTQALLDRYGLRILQTFATGVERPMSAEEVVRSGIETFVRLIETEPDIYRFIVVNTEGSEVLDDIAAPISALLRSEMSRQGLPAAGADDLAHAALGAVFTATESWCAHRQLPRDEFVDLLVGFVWGGLAAAGFRSDDHPMDLTAAAEAIAEAIEPLTP
jgi:AcrR family transcriptional regulator